MIQFSVYSRVTRNSDDAAKHKALIRRNLPPEGSVRVMTVTEKQYESMDLLIGDRTSDEKFLDTNDILMI